MRGLAFYTWIVPRRLGQHFLIRDSILERLASAACGEHVPRVIEIGPGRGALTRHLLPLTDELHVIELDRTLAAYLRDAFKDDRKLHVHEADVLATDLSQWGEAVVVGNLPYYITSPIIDKFLHLDERFCSAVFLMQWEVAERILAKPGSRDYGYLTCGGATAMRSKPGREGASFGVCSATNGGFGRRAVAKKGTATGRSRAPLNVCRPLFSTQAQNPPQQSAPVLRAGGGVLAGSGFARGAINHRSVRRASPAPRPVTYTG